MRDVVPHEPGAVHRLLVDADDAVARLREKADQLVPPERVVPALALRRALHRDADIGRGQRSSRIVERDLRPG